MVIAEKETKTFEVKIEAPAAKVEAPEAVPIPPDPNSDKPPQEGRSKVPGAVALGVGGVGVVLG